MVVSGHAVLLFDDVCNLCNACVNFVIDNDPGAIFRFAPLQSSCGQALLRAHQGDHQGLSSIVPIANDRVYTNSAAILQICARLGYPWRLLWLLVFIPWRVRDGVYGWIARNRYRWFGRSDTCRVPTPELEERFISSPGSPVTALLEA